MVLAAYALSAGCGRTTIIYRDRPSQPAETAAARPPTTAQPPATSAPQGQAPAQTGSNGPPGNGAAPAATGTADAPSAPGASPTAEALHTGARFAVRNVQGARMAKGEEVIKLVIRLDGYQVGECDVEYVEDDTCIKGVPLDPGVHQLQLAVGCRDSNGNTLTCRYSGEESFTVAAGQTVTYDFRASLQHTEDPGKYLVRSGEAVGTGSCIRSLVRLASAPSCTQAHVASAAEMAKQVGTQCSDEQLLSDTGMSLLVQASIQHFSQSPSRCIAASRLGSRRGLPDVLVRGAYRHGSWPPETLKRGTSTWSWSREGLPHDALDKQKGRQLLQAISTGLGTIRPRVAVFEQLSAAYGDTKERERFAKRIAAEPFSLDPRTPQGHATYLLMSMESITDRAFSDYVGTGVGDARRLHCGTPTLAERVARHMTHDDVITRAEWQGITAMAERTPSTARLHGCDYVFRRGLKGIDHAKRLRWLARFDCSDKRAEKLRGEQLESHLRDSMKGRGYDSLIDALRKQFASCIADK